MSETVEALRTYRAKMDDACEGLAIKLGELGVEKGRLDHEMVAFATTKIETLFKMLRASGLSEGILRAVMSE